MIRVHRIPFSTNVERVAIAARLKGLEVEWVDHDATDRAAVRALSGQDLVPVAELDDGEVVVDSVAILRRLEALAPSPPLWPASEADRARVDVLVEWFNEVWKRPPNAIAADRVAGRPDDPDAVARLRGWLDVFEGHLAGGDFLSGAELTAADVCAYPFLKYAVMEPDPTDDDPFHAVLLEHLALGPGYPRLRAWIERLGRV